MRSDSGGGRPAGAARPLRVLVVDDSAVVRQAVSTILGRHGGMQVAVAADPLIALQKLRVARPDVIVLDLEMPRMDGITFLRRLMAAEDPIPVVVCSGLTGPWQDAAIRALEEGAVEIVVKPTVGVRDFLHESAVRLIGVVRGAAGARISAVRRPPLADSPAVGGIRGARHGALRAGSPARLVAIGASTGGPEALRMVLEAMPADAPAIVVVQHMPPGFTAAFARHLDQGCRIAVKEAEEGDPVERGTALIAPGDRHLRIRRVAGRYVARLDSGEPVSRHRPSVDALFASVATAAGRDAVGVILTGMGDDGARGLAAMRDAGASTIAQDEATCVVFGMPAEAIRAGAAEEVVPLGAIADLVLRRAFRATTREM